MSSSLQDFLNAGLKSWEEQTHFFSLLSQLEPRTQHCRTVQFALKPRLPKVCLSTELSRLLAARADKKRRNQNTDFFWKSNKNSKSWHKYLLSETREGTFGAFVFSQMELSIWVSNFRFSEKATKIWLKFSLEFEV